MPLCSPNMPPLTISQWTSPPETSWTRSSMRPSESKMREPCSTFSARVLKVVPTRAAVPGTSRGVMVNCPPALSSTDWWPVSVEVRIFGPCRSPRMHNGLRSSRLTLRIIWISANFSSWLPWEKFRRITSTPARTRFRITGSVLEAGPSVATILARRGETGSVRLSGANDMGLLQGRFIGPRGRIGARPAE